MKIYGNVWKCMENQWKYIRKCMELYANVWPELSYSHHFLTNLMARGPTIRNEPAAKKRWRFRVRLSHFSDKNCHKLISIWRFWWRRVFDDKRKRNTPFFQNHRACRQSSKPSRLSTKVGTGQCGSMHSTRVAGLNRAFSPCQWGKRVWDDLHPTGNQIGPQSELF